MKWLFVALMCVAFVWVTPTEARAQTKKKDWNDIIIVIQRKPFLRKGRVELVPKFHVMFNDSLVQQLSLGANINYHINEWLFAGVTGGWEDWRFLSNTSTGFTRTYERVIDGTDAIPEASVITAYAGAVVGFVPLYGKFAVFNSAVIHWDLSVILGGGVVFTRASGISPAGMVGLNQRMFLLDWLSLNFDVRGVLYGDELSQVSGLQQQWLFGVGVGFWLPTSFEYESEE